MRLAVCVLVTGLAFAQGPAFEAASIRPHEGPLTRISDFSISGPRVTLVGYLTFGLIMEAYGLKRHEISYPTPRDDTFYDIVANADAPHSRDELRPFLQRLLADRFRLKVHWEERETPVYALVVAKGGPKLTDSKADTPTFHGGVNGRNQYIDAKRMKIEQLTTHLADFLGVDRPVVDRTGLKGDYDIRVEATPGWRRDSDPGDLSVFTAVQEQLGLKLEPAKAPLKVLVVDHVEKPSEN